MNDLPDRVDEAIKILERLEFDTEKSGNRFLSQLCKEAKWKMYFLRDTIEKQNNPNKCPCKCNCK